MNRVNNNIAKHTAATVEQAAAWLSEQYPAPQPALPVIRERFNLTALQGCEVLALAQKYRTKRRAFG